MERIMQGVVHGRTIELERDPQITDGSQVEIVLRLSRLPGPPPGWNSGSTTTAAGMMAEHWTDDDDSILEQIHRDRGRDSRREPAE